VAELWLQKLLELGVAGAMLYWFAIRSEVRQKNVEISVDRNARATALLVVALDVSKAATMQAHTIIEEIDDKRKREEKR